jgi:hypothetical protein
LKDTESITGIQSQFTSIFQHVAVSGLQTKIRIHGMNQSVVVNGQLCTEWCVSSEYNFTVHSLSLCLDASIEIYWSKMIFWCLLILVVVMLGAPECLRIASHQSNDERYKE